MIHACPCCGAKVAATPTTEIAARELPPVRAAVLRALAQDFGNFVSTHEIACRVWARDPSGGPLTAKVIISQSVRKMRPVLAAYGLAVEARMYSGYRVVKA